MPISNFLKRTGWVLLAIALADISGDIPTEDTGLLSWQRLLASALIIAALHLYAHKVVVPELEDDQR